jgi:hypothetical protein
MEEVVFGPVEGLTGRVHVQLSLEGLSVSRDPKCSLMENVVHGKK